MKKIKKVKVNRLFPIFILFMTILMGIGYASINSISLDFGGKLIAKDVTGIFITDANYESDENADLAESKILNAYQTSLTSKVVLSDEDKDSSITYKVTIYNSYDETYLFDSVKYLDDDDTYDNEEITFVLNGLDPGDELLGKDEITFTITFYYKDNTLAENNTLNSTLNFSFVKNVGLQNTLVKYIKNLYENGKKDIIVTSNMEYNYVFDESMMNDRLGSSDVDINGGNIRYYGLSPNNYIYFNCDDYSNQSSSTCELWRIVGVFGDKVKLVRAESLGNYSYDTKKTGIGSSRSNNGSNNWSDARLMMLLNPLYEDGVSNSIYELEGSLYWNAKKGDCYGETGVVECNFETTGLKNKETRDLISDNIWYINSVNTDRVYANEIYTREVAGSTWSGKISLLYPSDYAFAAHLGECKQVLAKYSDATCTNSNWLLDIITNNKTNTGWLLTPYTSATYSVYYVDQTGKVYFNNFYVKKSGSTAISLYLNSDVLLSKGKGTFAEPYELLVNE